MRQTPPKASNRGSVDWSQKSILTNLLAGYLALRVHWFKTGFADAEKSTRAGSYILPNPDCRKLEKCAAAVEPQSG